jgi:hypothetical protein
MSVVVTITPAVGNATVLLPLPAEITGTIELFPAPAYVEVGGGGGGGGGGVTDHGALTGLSDDDHAQYLNVSRGDARYPSIAALTAETNARAAHENRTDNPHAVTKAQVGLGNADNTSDANKPISTATQTALNGKEATGVAAGLVTTHENRTDNPHAVTKAQVGLGNADNTSDANKPISTATQTALDGKEPADADILKRDASTTLVAGFPVTPLDDGTKSSGTYTPSISSRQIQRVVNNGEHIFAPPAADGTAVVKYTNGASAGAITTSGFSKVDGAFTTTNGHVFFCYITRIDGHSHLNIVALQ